MSSKITLTSLLFAIAVSAIPIHTVSTAPSADGRPDGVHEVSFTVKFLEEDLSFGKFEGYDVVSLLEAGSEAEYGKPVLPVAQYLVAVPPGTEAFSVEARSLGMSEIPGLFLLLPGQPATRTDRRLAGLSVGPDAATYNSTRPFPGRLAVLGERGDLAGQELVHALVYPLQYLPSAERLILHDLIEVTVLCRPIGKEKAEDEERYSRVTGLQRETWEEMLRASVINPEDIHLDPGRDHRSTELPDARYDHVIITAEDYFDAFRPLADWHTKKGVRDTVVTSGWIFTTYEGPGDTLKMKQFIMDAASNWGTMYFLLSGEHQDIPFVYRTYYSQDTPSDQYYADFDGDWFHEVFVGRVPVQTVGQAETFVDKLLAYEKNPPLDDYTKSVLFLGFDLDASTPCEILKNEIDWYVPSDFTVTRIYDSDSGNHHTDTKAALDAGRHLVNHADHAGETVLGLGSVNHGWHLGTQDVMELVNDDRLSILVSLGCSPNAMDFNDCIAERFVVYNPRQAGIAFNGNTRSGYYNPGNFDGLSCKLDRDWWRAVFQYDRTNLGKALVWDKHSFFTTEPNVEVKMHCEWTFSLLGDPLMPIWLDTPRALEVSHYSRITTGESVFAVLVLEDGTPVEDATVCLRKPGDIYEVGSTGSLGAAFFHISPSTHGRMDVTVTARDHLPYEGSCSVSPPHARDPVETP